MQAQMLSSSFAGNKLTGRRGFAGSSLRARVALVPSAARRPGMDIRAEKVVRICGCRHGDKFA